MIKICQNCGNEGTQVYCAQCGQPLEMKRITLDHLVHEVAHTFWHLEKGFLYTLKELAIHPGTMQRKYLSGIRLRYQKPFPLFAISVTICALTMYLIYLDAPVKTIDYFYKHYWFIVQASMLPFYALITYLLFKNQVLYYAEALVLTAYMLGFMSILILPLNALSFFFPNWMISSLEVICLVTYNTWTNLNFFKGKAKWWVIVKSIAGIVVSYLLFQLASNLIMDWFM